MQLREYQKRACVAIVRALHATSKNPCVVLPTGAGKTAVITTVAQYLIEKERGRVLILSHRKELIEQTAATLESRFNTSAAVFSAGLGEKETDGSIVIGGIQSVASDLARFTEAAPFTHLIIDEAHLIPNLDDESSQYQKLIKALRDNYPPLRVIGFTATPYRLDSGLLCSDDSVLNYNCFEVKTADLIEQGFLSNLTTCAVDIGLEQTESSDPEEVLKTAVDNIIKATADRNKIIIFCSSVKHAQLVENYLWAKTGSGVGLISGSSSVQDREYYIKRFKTDSVAGPLGYDINPLKYLVNVDVLTTGFDAPNIDCVVLLRRTQSRALYVQMIGRGLRKYPGKQDCLVLDFAGNIARHGAIDDYSCAPAAKVKVKKADDTFKKCKNCGSMCPRSADACSCGYSFDKIICPYCKQASLLSLSHCQYCGKLLVSIPHAGAYDTTGALILGDTDLLKGVRPVKDRVKDVRYEFTYSRKSGAPMLIEKITTELDEKISQFIMFESASLYPREKARKWWRARTNAPLPQSCLQAYYYAIAGRLGKPTAVSYKPRAAGDKYTRLLRAKVEPLLCDPSELNTENPLNLACPKCGSGFFSYVKLNGRPRVICACCNSSVRIFQDFESIEIEKKENIKFITPNPRLY